MGHAKALGEDIMGNTLYGMSCIWLWYSNDYGVCLGVGLCAETCILDGVV
jgi:hypothetical protein